MSLQTAVELHCDGCGFWFRIEEGMKGEWPALKKEGWTRKQGRHWCKLCGLEGSWENHPQAEPEYK